MRSGYVKSVAVAAFAALWILPVIARAQLIDLGATTGYALNNSGEAALASGVYANGAVVPVPALSNQVGTGEPHAINDNGQSAGFAGLNEGASGVNPRVATLYSGTTATDLFPAADDTGNQNADWSGTATSINSAGTVLGYYQIGIRDDETYVFTYAGGTMTLINVPCGLNETGSAFTSKFCGPNAQDVNFPFGINDSGEVVGTIAYDDSPSYGYLINNGVWTSFGQGTAYAINAGGQVTGSILEPFSDGTYPTYAFLNKNGTTTNLGTLSGGKHSTGYAIEPSAARRDLRPEMKSLQVQLSKLAALVDHYYAAYRETQTLLERRDREIAELRRGLKSPPTQLRR